MRTLIHFLIFLAAGIGIGMPLAAQTPKADVAGGRDHPLVGRYQGAALRVMQARDFDEFRMLSRPMSTREVDREGGTVGVAGRAWRLRYDGIENRSPLEVMRNHQEQLQAGRFEILFSCRGNECGQPAAFGTAVVRSVSGPNPGLAPGWADMAYTLARLRRAEGDVHVAILVVGLRGGAQVLVDVVEARPMQTGQITFVDASAMQRAVEQTGRVALYGIQFATDSAEILSASRPTLEEIGKFLRANPAMNVVVAGHTDGQGMFDYNVQLSARRAQTIAAALARDHGVATGRMTAFGAGMAAPVARNDSEEGRAQNRRVEIVKR